MLCTFIVHLHMSLQLTLPLTLPNKFANWIIISCFMLNRGITINDQQLRGVNFDVELYTLYTCIKLIDPTVKLCKSENGYSVIVGVYS